MESLEICKNCGHGKEMHKNKDGSLGFCLSCDFLSHTGKTCEQFE